MPEILLAKGELIRRGVVDAINIPGFALGSTMTGFAVIAKEAGFDFWMVVATTASVWGLPGQSRLRQPLCHGRIIDADFCGSGACQHANDADGDLGCGHSASAHA